MRKGLGARVEGRVSSDEGRGTGVEGRGTRDEGRGSRVEGRGSRDGWRVSSGCTRQSLAENAVSRFKALFGGKLVARTFESQHVEASVKCAVMNRMTALGMPISQKISA